MKQRVGKFVLAALAHGGMLFVIYSTVLAFFILKYQQDVNPLFITMVHVFFSLGYFCILLLKLYAYDYNYFWNFSKEIILRSLLASVLFVLGAVLMVFLLNSLLALGTGSAPLHPIERYLTLTFFIVIIDIIAFVGLYALQFLWVSHLIALGYLKKNVLVIGDPDDRFPLAWFEDGDVTKNYQGRLFRREGDWLFHKKNNGVLTIPPQKIRELFFELKIGEVIVFLCDALSRDDVSMLLDHLKENSINYYLVPDVTKVSRDPVRDGAFPYIPIIKKFVTRRDSVTHITMKRLFDIVFVALSFFLVIPLGLIVALLIKLGDGGPVFYTHRRVGKNGKIIRFYKFRSMIAGADGLKQQLLRFNQRGNGPLFKMKNDPRITPVGRVIRKYSLDELPQLLNVLKGDMSLVGPRPHLIEEVNEYAERDMLRLECIPGITCLPQIQGRDMVDFREWIELDLVYRKKWSNSLDLKILVRSLNEVISPLFKKIL